MTSHIKTRKVLSTVAASYAEQSFVAEKIAPSVLVNDVSGKIYARGKEKLKPHDDAWKAGSKATLVDFDYSSVNYDLEQRKLAVALKKDALANADTPLDLEQDATEILTSIIQLNHEKRIQAITQGNGSITNTQGAAAEWDQSGATPKADVDSVREQIRADVGRYPNVILMSTEVRNDLVQYLLDKAQITYGEAAQTIELPASVFGMTPVVPECVENTANIGQTASISDVWSNVVFMCVVERPSLFFGGAFVCPRRKTFNGDPLTVQGWRVRRLELEEDEVVKIEVATEVDEVTVDLTAAGTVTGVV
jgi:hypothetical protein